MGAGFFCVRFGKISLSPGLPDIRCAEKCYGVWFLWVSDSQLTPLET